MPLLPLFDKKCITDKTTALPDAIAHIFFDCSASLTGLELVCGRNSPQRAPDELKRLKIKVFDGFIELAHGINFAQRKYAPRPDVELRELGGAPVLW